MTLFKVAYSTICSKCLQPIDKGELAVIENNKVYCPVCKEYKQVSKKLTEGMMLEERLKA